MHWFKAEIVELAPARINVTTERLAWPQLLERSFGRLREGLTDQRVLGTSFGGLMLSQQSATVAFSAQEWVSEGWDADVGRSLKWDNRKS